MAGAPERGWRRRNCAGIYKVQASRIGESEDSKFANRRRAEDLLPGQYEVAATSAFDCRRQAEVENLANLKGSLVIYRGNVLTL